MKPMVIWFFLCNIGCCIHSAIGVTMAVNIQKARRFGGKVEISAGILNWQNF